MSAHSSNTAVTNIKYGKFIITNSGKCPENAQRIMIMFTQDTNKAATNSRPSVNSKLLCYVEKTDKKRFVRHESTDKKRFVWHESTAKSLPHSHSIHVCCGFKWTHLRCDHICRCCVLAVRVHLDPVLYKHRVCRQNVCKCIYAALDGLDTTWYFIICINLEIKNCCEKKIILDEKLRTCFKLFGTPFVVFFPNQSVFLKCI